MMRDDPYEPDDAHIQNRSYVEFTLPKTDLDNITSIEKSLADGKITSNNSADSLDYLTRLYKKVFDVKKQEYHYEGDNNENVNEYLERISVLRSKLLSLR
jgi:hypothetical protein